jgi:ribosomal protein L37E
MKSFIKNKEDFICEHCGAQIMGTGYTNHCHECFYSKHVDIQPGDRLEACKGIMKPISVQGSINNLTITHECLLCGFKRNNKIQSKDNLEALADLIKKINLKR